MFSDFFKTLGNRFIAGGDWNAKHSHWGSRITNTLIKSSLDGSSDHTPVILILSPIAIPHDSGTDYLHNSKTDWDCFREYLESNIDLKLSLKTNEEVDNASLYITNLIQLSHRASDKTKLNRAIKELKNLLAETTNDMIKKRLEKMSPNGHGAYNLWKATKSLPQPQQCSPPIRSGSTWARTDQEKSEAFAIHLSSVFKPNDADTPEDPEIEAILKQDLQMCLPLRHTTPKELTKIISKMNPNKSPGFDLITPRLLKELPRKCLVFLTILFNATFRTSHVPTLWKTSQIVMIHKPGKPPNEASSYRPISLTPVLSKLWERIVLERLSPCLEINYVIPDHQYGFRKHHSTIEQVHRVYSTIRQCLEQKEYCSAAFLDVQQAFDRVWHKGLLCKIKKILPHSYYLLMSSYLCDRTFQVKLRDARSSLYTCLAGVPQGSVLGPVLYNIFTSDLPQSPKVAVATFADDAAFLACSRDPKQASTLLQSQLNITHDWLTKWRIKASAQNRIISRLRLDLKLAPQST
ncbi:Probable RNA-directed DNA polymerase from transposon BS [Eumeta japonica]|uniref:Probable RNA-directed DNA polymerase from transposon BS n=1 Tax=Eumeta variegata TaxID=151549 RepID=A0A4C1VBB5_EUMVA|nr:Probable RNA-directed DNA polymerase from transposon BS [Eumeta japonica]